MKKVLLPLTLMGTGLFAHPSSTQSSSKRDFNQDYNSQGSQMGQPTITPLCH